MVVGPSGSGKSQFVNKMISEKDVLFDDPPERIVWCYGIWQSFYKTLGHEFHEGIPTDDFLDSGNMILVIDDLMDEAQGSVSTIFTRTSHHRNITCIFLSQNLFPKNKFARNISLNSNYIVLMKNCRDKAQISHLARQVYPNNSKFLVEAYHDATREPYTYLLLDFKPETDETNRICTGILSSETTYVYQPKTI
jgi:adenylate kinase family enzyme